MAFIGYKILATEGFTHEVSYISFREKNFLNKAHLEITIKEGFGGTRLKYFKGDFELMEIVHEEQTSDDTGQRIKHGAIGAVLLGPIGLLGAAFGGKKVQLKVRFVTKKEQKFLLELDTGDCQKLFKEFMDVDLEKEINKNLL